MFGDKGHSQHVVPHPPSLRLLGGDGDRLDMSPSLGDSHHGYETRDSAQIAGISQRVFSEPGPCLWRWVYCDAEASSL